jgi:hypothetical protein
MKNLTFIVFAIICCSTYSCKKKQNDAITNSPKTTIDTVKVDLREKYKGLFMINVKHVSWYDTSTQYNAYDMLVYINYTSTDSVIWGTISGTTLLKMPALSLYDNATMSLFRKIGVDTIGKIYNQLDGFNIFGGGFVNMDSLNGYIGTHGWHDGYVDTLVGHRL